MASSTVSISGYRQAARYAHHEMVSCYARCCHTAKQRVHTRYAYVLKPATECVPHQVSNFGMGSLLRLAYLNASRGPARMSLCLIVSSYSIRPDSEKAATDEVGHHSNPPGPGDTDDLPRDPCLRKRPIQIRRRRRNVILYRHTHFLGSITGSKRASRSTFTLLQAPVLTAAIANPPKRWLGRQAGGGRTKGDLLVW